MMAFAGAFPTKQQFTHPHCIVYYDKIWTKTVLTCFTKLIAEHAIPDPVCKKDKYAISTDNKFMIFFFDFVIE